MNPFKKSDSPFKVPKGYFESLEDRMDHIEGDERRNENHSVENKDDYVPTLTEIIGKEPGFKVPDGYFKDLGSEVPFKKEQKIIPLKKQFIRILSLATAACILLFFGLNSINSKYDNIDKLEFQDEEIASWLESDLIEFDSYEIAEAFDDVELDHYLYDEDGIDDYLNTLDIEHLILDNN